MKEMITYEELRKLAIQSGIKDNRVMVGIWAKLNGYSQKRKQIDKVMKIYYYKDNK